MSFFVRLKNITQIRPSLFSSHSKFFSGGASKPSWKIPKEYRWGPEIPDRYYFWEHSTYTGFVLWLRGCRPYIEMAFTDTWLLLKHYFSPPLNAFKETFIYHNPDIRLQVIACLSMYLTTQSIIMMLNRSYQKLMDLKYLRSLEEAKRLDEEGFWDTDEEDLQKRLKLYTTHHCRLNDLWYNALTKASLEPTAEKGWKKLCNFLMDDQIAYPLLNIVPPVTWRFSMIPYDNNDATTFPIPDHEQPHRAFALNFTYNNLLYDWGDYINRKDNKSSILRPVRHMFTDVYIPPTK